MTLKIHKIGVCWFEQILPLLQLFLHLENELLFNSVHELMLGSSGGAKSPGFSRFGLGQKL